MRVHTQHGMIGTLVVLVVGIALIIGIAVYVVGRMPQEAQLNTNTTNQPGGSRTNREQQSEETVSIFFIALDDNGATGTSIGCGDSVVPVEQRIAATLDPLPAALTALLSNHDQYYGESGLYNSLYQSRLEVADAEIENGTAFVHLKGTHQLGGVCDEPRFRAQLEETVRQFTGVTEVEIFINNTPLNEVLSEQ